MHATHARIRTLIIAAALCLSACSSGDSGPGMPGDDHFAVGTQPLSLEPAPGGLSEGGGADKECGPEGCAQPPAAATDAQNRSAPSGSSFSGAVPTTPGSGAALPMSSPAGFAGSASTPLPQQPSMMAMPPGAAATADAGSAPDAACANGPDAGTLPDGGPLPECEDAGVQAAAQALITDDVPGCATINPGHATTLFMSADDSGSMAGPAIARRMINAGRRVPVNVIRPWEFLNYYDFSFEPAEPGMVRIVPQLSSCPENNRLSLQVALQAEARDTLQRAPLTITFVVDTSGSMQTNTLGGDAPITLAREAILALAAQLREGDVVSMVTWNTEQLEILRGHHITGVNDPALVDAARGLQANGGTDLHAGLVHGYKLAEDFYGPGRINRVILISDGIANVGVTDEQLIAQHSNDEEGEAGIYLAGIGVGDGFNDTLMNAVTDAGRGAYVYLDSISEAHRMMEGRYLQVVDIAARAVRLEVTLPYYLVLEQFFGEVASTDAAKVRPQHLGPNDSMLFFQVLRACDASMLHGDDRIRLRATWQTPIQRIAHEAIVDTTLNQLAGNDDDLTKAAAIAAYAEALIAAGTVTDSSQSLAFLEHALTVVRAAKDAATDPDLIEVAALLTRYKQQFGAMGFVGVVPPPMLPPAP